METDENDQPLAPSVHQTIKSTFEGVTRPVTAEELADVYAALFAQYEALQACYVLALRMMPMTDAEQQVDRVDKELETSLSILTESLLKLAKNSMSDEEKVEDDE